MENLKHVAIILDGNGRWAKKRNLSRSMGHKKGFENVNTLAEHVFSTGVEVLSVFAFSTENFKRSDEEVNYLMDTFVNKFNKEKNFFNDKNIKVIFSGRKEPLREDVYESMQEITKMTERNTGGIFNICLNYGGQSEIVDAVKDIVYAVENYNYDINSLNEKTFYNFLYNDLPPIDLMIRTSGELRISNFLLFQLAYAELYFTDTYFPDFDAKAYDKAIEEFKNRNRRFGGYDKKS